VGGHGAPVLGGHVAIGSETTELAVLVDVAQVVDHQLLGLRRDTRDTVSSFPDVQAFGASARHLRPLCRGSPGGAPDGVGDHGAGRYD